MALGSIRKNFGKKLVDKRITVIYVVVIFVLILGVTLAMQKSSLAFGVRTAMLGIDESKYGNTSFDSSKLDFSPILDTDVETSTGKVIKIDFKVGGASTNNASDAIYDIALNDLNVSCELLSKYIKWKLVKNGTEISTGSLSYTFDTIDNGRMVLTNTQQDLPSYNSSGTGYDQYSFYMWFSDSCQSTLSQCRANGNMVDQSNLLGKYLAGKIEVELYRGSKKALVRKPGTSLDTSTCGFSLSTVKAGSYVDYTGNNGCSGDACKGQNANYVSDADMGYCSDSGYKFMVNGWRVAYTKNGSAYLVSAGAPECMCTKGDGISSNSSCSSSYETTSGAPLHLANLNNNALKYCNPTYAYGGVCNSSSAWAMNANDFQNITGKALNSSSCYYNFSDRSCGYENDLIDNGSYYWFATSYDWTSASIFRWHAYGQTVIATNSNFLYGLRPVIRLSSNVVVIGGAGTAEDPYKIKKSENEAKPEKRLLSDAEAGSYVAYTGNNGCSGEACKGQNANYVSATDKGYCFQDKFIVNGWRVAYIKNNSAYLVSAGSPECMCTNSDGTSSNSSCSSSVPASILSSHLTNLNNGALKYCNKAYAYGGVCNSSSVWAMNGDDFQVITGRSIFDSSCDYASYDKTCGYRNDLIDNGSNYWYATAYGSSSDNFLTFQWWSYGTRSSLGVNSQASDQVLGLRPVIRLRSDVEIVSGDGTETDPYVIK